MEQAKLETRPLYGIGTVARLTGLKPDTLRVWERRYGLGASRKSDTGRRQYTQADMEHLQLVAALIQSGARIGEIAASDRKTLESLCRNRIGKSAIPPAKARVLFLGPELCKWIDAHQGCMANMHSELAGLSLDEIEPVSLSGHGPVDTLVVEISNLSEGQLERVETLRTAVNASRVIISSRVHSAAWIQELNQREITLLELPPDPARLVFEIARTLAEKDTVAGNTDLGELVAVKPREFTPVELSAASALRSTLDCECPKHLSRLITALVEFEEYSAGCSVKNWQDAAIHACIYAYAGQARWLMERALNAAIEERGEEFSRELEREQRLAVD